MSLPPILVSPNPGSSGLHVASQQHSDRVKVTALPDEQSAPTICQEPLNVISAKGERPPDLGDQPRQSVCSSRREKKIRGLEVLMGWFESRGYGELKEPYLYDGARPGDIFVHTFGSCGQQVWMLGENGIWAGVYPAQEHPTVPTHRLFIAEGRPSWVTRKTVATYGYRKKGDPK